ncbi:hypothetical protein [Myroides sp. TSA_177.3]|uniref:hypothetical protein n=1 Tax=Myroides sp. TSA_177.3 TaxID=3415650 RepID=UPI0040462940
MLNWFNNLDTILQTAIISLITSITIMVLTWIIGILKDRYSLNYKLKKEYEFSQRKKLKEEIAKNKMPLLNSIEELNYRVYNLNINLNKGWLNISEHNWFINEQYFLNSSIYRMLEFWYWIIKTERDTISIDSTIADDEDILFLTYIKTFKNIFCDAEILKELGYNSSQDTNHFFKNDLETYGNWLIENDKLIGFEEFKTKLKLNYVGYKKVIEYWTSIKDIDSDKNLNAMRAFHLISINFLNKFGHNYQKTNTKKIKILTKSYNTKLKIKSGFKDFLIKNKLDKEMKYIMKELNKN